MPTICRKVVRCDKKLCVVLIKADIFLTKVCKEIYPRNLYIKFDVNTLRHSGEMACVERLPAFGNSDITIYIVFVGCC